MADRNTVINDFGVGTTTRIQDGDAGAAAANWPRATDSWKRIRVSNVGRDSGGASELIDCRGWDAMRWHPFNMVFKYAFTQTTSSVDWGSAGTWYRIAQPTPGATSITERWKLVAKISIVTTRFQVWQRPVVDELSRNRNANGSANTTETCGTSLYGNQFITRLAGGFVVSDDTTTWGSGGAAGQSEPATGDKITNSDIIGVWNYAPPGLVNSSVGIANGYKLARTVFPVGQAFDPVWYAAGETHDHTVSQMATDLNFGSNGLDGALPEFGDYRPAALDGTTAGDSIRRIQSGYCTNPLPYVYFYATRRDQVFGNQAVNFDLCVDFYKRPQPNHRAYLQGWDISNSETKVSIG